MKRKALPLLIVVFLLSGQTSWAVAQQTPTGGDWSAVQRIGTDEKLIVKKTDGKEVKGRMIEAMHVDEARALLAKARISSESLASGGAAP